MYDFTLHMSDGGVMVSIVAFQAVDPGSIPGHRILLKDFSKFLNFKKKQENKY